MANEDKVKKLEAKIKELENRVGIQEDIEEIRHLMSKYENWHVPSKVCDTWKLFALKQPDVSAEIDNWGVWVGPEPVKKLYEIGHKIPLVGSMTVHHLDTYMIQVAKDRKTAKAIFYSPGHETFVRKEGKIATWCWGKYGNDFIREDGEWKIWHLHWYTTFRTPYDRSWQEPYEVPFVETMRSKVPNQKPCTYHKPYSVDVVFDEMPPYPEPYDTWDGKSMA